MRVFLILFAGSLLNICFAAADHTRVNIPADDTDPKLLAEVQQLEARIEEIRAIFPIEKRVSVSQKLESKLKSLVPRTADSRLHNKALYLLASWRLEYEPKGDIEGPLQKIIRSPHLHYQNLAKVQLARLRLSQNRIKEARQIGEEVVDSIPQLAGLMREILFHEQTGQPAPTLTLTSLNGSSEDPLHAHKEPWQLWCFANILKPSDRWELRGLLEEIAKAEYAGVIKVILVSFDSNTLAVLRAFHEEVPGADRISLHWLPPSDPIITESWKDAWRLPALPATTLVGPDRRIMAAYPSVSDVQILIGKKPQKSQPKKRKSSFGIKGRYKR